MEAATWKPEWEAEWKEKGVPSSLRGFRYEDLAGPPLKRVVARRSGWMKELGEVVRKRHDGGVLERRNSVIANPGDKATYLS